MPPGYTCTFFLLCLLVAVRFPTGGAAPAPAPSIADQFEKWIVTTGRRYKDKAEKDARFKIFQTNVAFIDAFNRNRSNTYSLGVNQFADRTNQEYRKMVGVTLPPQRAEMENFTASLLEHIDAANVPENVDWRIIGGVTPAKNQGECGSCWAFCTVALLETLNFIKTRQLLTLSEQQIIDCSPRDPHLPADRCLGGTMEDAYNYVIHNKGIAQAKDYPYVERGTDPCDARRVGHNAPITGFKYGPVYDEAALKLLVSTRPVGIAMQSGASEFEYFVGNSVWSFKGDCGGTWHGMVLFGYGVEPDGTKYWLVKNSYGRLWGNYGFGKIAREVPGMGPRGVCSMATYITWPTWD